MERNALSFLDLVTQFLAVMIIVIAVSSKSGQGVGLIKPDSEYEMICATFPRENHGDQPIATTADKNGCSIRMITTDKSTILMISARRREKTGMGQKTAVQIQKEWLSRAATIRHWTPQHPDASILILGTLKVNITPTLITFIETP